LWECRKRLVKVAGTSEEMRVERERAAEKLVYERERGGEGDRERIRGVQDEASGCRGRACGGVAGVRERERERE
jgi:hypothetical protein